MAESMPLGKIRKYWTEPARSSSRHEPLVHLLDGIAEHAIPAPGEDYQHFREEMRKLRDSVGSLDLEGVRDTVDTACDLMRTWNAGVRRSAERRTDETSGMIASLAEVIAGPGQNNDGGALRLLVKAISLPTGTDDLQKIRAEMERCLSAVKETLQRRQRETEMRIEDLEHQVARLREKVDWQGEEDPDTGLTGRSDAESAIREVLQIPEPSFCRHYVLVVVLDHLHGVNARFGYTVGDQLFRSTCDYLESHLKAGERVYRWTGPTVVAILKREGSFDQVERELGRFLDVRPERLFELGGHTAIVRIKVKWALFELSGSFGPVAAKIRETITTYTPRELAGTTV